MRFPLAALALALAAGSVLAEPPKIVASPGASAPMPAVGVPVHLDVGKLLWLNLDGYEGAVTWDFLGGSAVALPPDGDGPLWAGWKQGDAGFAWHRVPPGRFPAFAATIDAGKFAFADIPDLKGRRYGGTKQGESAPTWHDLPAPASTPLLGIAKGSVTVSAWGVVANRPKKLAELVIEVRGPPDGDAKPNPKPDTDPAKSRKFAAYVVYESADKSAKWSQFFADKALADRWTAKGHLPPVLADQDVKDGKTKQPPAKLVPYLNRAKGKSLPQLYLIDAATGDVAYEGPAPESPAELLKLLDKVGG